MDLSLKGRTALITGSTRGLGRAITEALAQEGVNVIINGRWDKTVAETAYEIEHKFDHKIRAYQCVCDTTNLEAVKTFFEKQILVSKLDILVNNVGHAEKFGGFFDLTDEDWFDCFDLVCMSTVRLIREAIPFLRASGRGRIINISSLSSHQPGNFNHHYVCAKATINILTKQLAPFLAKYNILINAICPSTLGGGSWKRNVADRARRSNISLEEAESIMRLEELQKSPLYQIGTLANVADMVVYLASDRANFQTGHIYDIDGGITKGL